MLLDGRIFPEAHEIRESLTEGDQTGIPAHTERLLGDPTQECGDQLFGIFLSCKQFEDRRKHLQVEKAKGSGFIENDFPPLLIDARPAQGSLQQQCGSDTDFVETHRRLVERLEKKIHRSRIRRDLGKTCQRAYVRSSVSAVHSHIHGHIEEDIGNRLSSGKGGAVWSGLKKSLHGFRCVDLVAGLELKFGEPHDGREPGIRTRIGTGIGSCLAAFEKTDRRVHFASLHAKLSHLVEEWTF